MIQKIRKAGTFEEIELLQEELFDIFKQVIVDLDEDRIDSDSFHSFTFTWETAIKNVGIEKKYCKILQNLQLVSRDLEGDLTSVKEQKI